MKAIDVVTGKSLAKSYLSSNSARRNPVKEPIKSMITEYLLIDLKKEEAEHGGEVDILELLNPITDETRSLRIKREEGNQGDLVRGVWEKVNNSSPNHSVTVRVLDITWSGEDGMECTEGSIMDSHLWEE